MAKQQRSSKRFYAVAGALLLSLGLLLLFANLDEVATGISNSLSSTPGTVGAVIEIGDHAAFQAGLRWILGSLWPLILVIIGATLLHNAIGRRYANPRLARSFSPREYENES